MKIWKKTQKNSKKLSFEREKNVKKVFFWLFY